MKQSSKEVLAAKTAAKAKAAVITVQNGGRGFVVEHGHNRLVITAAHCLPFFPPCHGASSIEERTYRKFLAPLGGEPAIWAACLFADPVADIAVLGSPDDQELSDEARAYDDLMEAATPLAISDAPEKGSGWLLSLDGEWFKCLVENVGGMLWLSDPAKPIPGGMSGSPIISARGKAMGVVCTSAEGPAKLGFHGPNPRLFANLPGWLLSAPKRPKPPPELLSIRV